MPGIFARYLSDPEVETLAGEAALIRRMLGVEIALAQVQARQGAIPAPAAQAIARRLRDFAPPPEALAEGTLQNGIPVIPLLALARQQLPAEARDYLHWGATSQDILDTATVLMLKDVLAVLEKRLQGILENLGSLEQRHKQTWTVARTRNQQAVPVFFAQKVENWRQPLERHQHRLQELKPRLLLVQLGGAGGNLAALGNRGVETARLLAAELGLAFAGVWHNQRDGVAELAAWLGLLAGSLGKMAQDILLLSQTETGEVVEQQGAGGRSSAMPHKSNPVLSEAILALAQYTGHLAGLLFQSMLHRQERDGAALALEWLSLPQILTAGGAMLNHALVVSKNIGVSERAMRANLERLGGLVFSEKAVLILCRHMSRAEAKRAVEEACDLVSHQGIHLAEALGRRLPELDLDWEAILQPD